MPAQMKRPAAASANVPGAGKPKAKRQQEDPLVSKCNITISLLASAEGYPPETLQMLAGAVQGCLAVPKADRHEVQNGVIEMISEVACSVESRHAAKVTALQARISEADAEKLNREAAVEAAAALKSDKADAVRASETALEAAGTLLATAQTELQVAATEQRSGDADLAKAEETKSSAESLMSTALTSLKDGTAPDVLTAIKSVKAGGIDLGLEDQLISSAMIALDKGPAERGGFDGIVIQQLDEQIGSAVRKLTEQLAGGEAGKAERATKVEARKQQLEGAVADQEARRDNLQGAKVSLEEAEGAKAAAQKAVKDFGLEMREAEDSAEAADALLVACRADLAVFQELVEGMPIVLEAVATKVGDTGDAAAPESAVDQV